MPFIGWAIHMIQWYLQGVAGICILANLKKYLGSDCNLKLGYMKEE